MRSKGFHKTSRTVVALMAMAVLVLNYQNCSPGFKSLGSAGISQLSTTSPTASTLEMGVYGQNSAAAVTQFETFLGRKADGILVYAGSASWSDFDSSIGWSITTVLPTNIVDHKIYWSLPLIVTGATLDIGATGAYNSYYLQAAQQIAATRPNDEFINIRTGWELNGNWFPWAAQGHEQAYIDTYKQFVTTFRSVSPRFRFEWNANLGDNGENPELSYPGDAYVDIIGMDAYYNPQYSNVDPTLAFAYNVSRTYGLQWHQDFAAMHGKPTSYSEWGVTGDNSGPYIILMKQWMIDHKVVFHSYWDSNSAYTGQLSGGQFPTAAAVFKDAFGNAITY